jgi:hypothetical protein
VCDFGDDEQVLSVAEDRVPYGANFAIRTIEQRRFRYNPRLGRSPRHSRSGEEWDVISRLLGSGATGRWIPQAVVEHCIGHERQTASYIVKYSMNIGETHAYQFGVSRRLWPSLLKRWFLYHLHRRISPAPIWVAHLQAYARIKGMLRYWRESEE